MNKKIINSKENQNQIKFKWFSASNKPSIKSFLTNVCQTSLQSNTRNIITIKTDKKSLLIQMKNQIPFTQIQVNYSQKVIPILKDLKNHILQSQTREQPNKEPLTTLKTTDRKCHMHTHTQANNKSRMLKTNGKTITI